MIASAGRRLQKTQFALTLFFIQLSSKWNISLPSVYELHYC